MGMKLSAEVRADQVGADVHRLLRQVVDKAAYDVEGHAKTAIQTGPKTGRKYGKHQASAPGEAPATDTSNLVNSIQTTSEIGPVIRSTVSVGAEYGPDLEFGTEDMAPRPFIGPAMDTVEPSFIRGCAAAVKQGAQGG